MPVIIDLGTPEKMDAFGKAISAAAVRERVVSLADVAEESGTLSGPKVCYETEHYQIVDRGADAVDRGLTSRFHLERRPYKFHDCYVLHYPPRGENHSAEALLDELKAAEAFHQSNAP